MPWSNQPVISPLVIIAAGPPNTGLFVYAGTPANGNLLFSIAAAASTDSFGNAYDRGIVSYNFFGGKTKLYGTEIDISTVPGIQTIINTSGIFFYSPGAGAGNLVASMTTASGTDAYTNAYQAGLTSYGPSNSLAQLLAGGINLAGGTTAADATIGGVNGNLIIDSGIATAGQASARMELAHGPSVQGSVITDPLLAWNPGSIHVSAEIWHTITLDAGWSTAAGHAAPSYRLLPDGNVQLTGFASHASFTTATNLNGSNPLPAAYQPATVKYLRSGDGNRAGMTVGTNGVITAFPVSGGSTQLELDSIYPVNL